MKFYMLVGLPGSGKSYWANQNHGKLFDRLFSSDYYRELICGSVEDQSKNDEVFSKLYSDMITALEDGYSVCFDATNISRKDRARCFEKIKNILCDTEAVLFATLLDTVYEQNKNREHPVPDYVIDKMLKRFEIPYQGEGFDDIRVIYSKGIDKKLHYDLPHYDIDIWRNEMKDFDQKNSHHTLNLADHCDKAWQFLDDGQCKYDTMSYNYALRCAALIHDYGKLFTQTIDENGEAHYYNHENVGAYRALFFDYNGLGDPYKVAFYINYHMLPMHVEKMKPAKREKTIRSFGRKWGDLLLLHAADVLAK